MAESLPADGSVLDGVGLVGADHLAGWLAVRDVSQDREQVAVGEASGRGRKSQGLVDSVVAQDGGQLDRAGHLGADAGGAGGSGFLESASRAGADAHERVHSVTRVQIDLLKGARARVYGHKVGKLQDQVARKKWIQRNCPTCRASAGQECFDAVPDGQPLRRFGGNDERLLLVIASREEAAAQASHDRCGSWVASGSLWLLLPGGRVAGFPPIPIEEETGVIGVGMVGSQHSYVVGQQRLERGHGVSRTP